ncbi:MAG: SCO family protein [Alphaproteobacteria bacterium]
MVSTLGVGSASERPPGPQEALKLSQAAIGREIGDYSFRDGTGQVVRLREFRGRPLVLALVYTACSNACPLILRSANAALETAWGTLGADRMSAIAIGFDSVHDSPERLREFAAQQGLSSKKWKFLGADAETIRKLANDVGFVFYLSPKGFDHLAQITVVDAEGRIYRQVYGDTFEAPRLVEPLRDLVRGGWSEPVSLDDLLTRVRLFCTLYDPVSGRYRVSYALFFEMFVAGCAVVGLLWFLFRNWRRPTG